MFLVQRGTWDDWNTNCRKNCCRLEPSDSEHSYYELFLVRTRYNSKTERLSKLFSVRKSCTTKKLTTAGSADCKTFTQPWIDFACCHWNENFCWMFIKAEVQSFRPSTQFCFLTDLNLNSKWNISLSCSLPCCLHLSQLRYLQTSSLLLHHLTAQQERDLTILHHPIQLMEMKAATAPHPAVQTRPARRNIRSIEISRSSINFVNK